MVLSKQRRIFSSNISTLIKWAIDQGYEVTIGEVLRTKEQQEIYVKEGKSQTMNSMHLLGLATDLNLFVNGVYSTDPIQYKILGDKWGTLNPKNRWGGDFNKDGEIDTKFCDYDHFEMTNT